MATRTLGGLVGLLSAGGVGDADLVGDLSDALLCLAAVSAAGCCVVRAARLRGRERTGWALVGLSALSWGLGQACRLGLESLRGVVPFPSVADVGFLGMVVLMAAGMLVLPVVAQAPAARARSVLDGLMVGASMLLVAWIFVIEPIMEAGGDSASALAISLAYPLGDVMIATIVLYSLALQRRRGRTMAHLVLVGAGVVAFSASDVGYAYRNLIGTYASGSVVDAGWFVGFTLIVVAARRPMKGVPTAGPESAAADDDGDSRPFAVLLPYVAVLTALAVSVVWSARPGHGSPFLAYAWSVLILLIVGRQALTVLENRALTGNLEARVRARTAELYASEQRFRALVQHSSDVVAVVDRDSVVLYQSESIERVFGYPQEVSAGRRLVELFGGSSGARLAGALRAVAAVPRGTTVLELPVPHTDGGVRQAEMTITNLLDDPNVGGLVLNTRDVSDSRTLQDRLRHEAHHDSLTRLANRARFSEKVREALWASRRTDDVVVLFLDLDGFKQVNDSLGHAAGDRWLVQVADRLRAAIREDDLVARFGGDEFAVLVRSIVALADAQTVARRIVDGLREPFHIGGRDLHVGASVGLASAGDAADAEQLLRNADLAMYRAKAAGGDTSVTYHPEMLSSLLDRLALEADLRHAVDNDGLHLHYQATIDLADDTVTGFEALVRWDHPARGPIPPAQFIPVAEATGIIVALGRWVLTEACRQALAWITDHPGLTIAVNISAHQFDRTDIVATVTDVLAETGLPATNLCLEMTESVLITETDHNASQLTRLKALGVTVAVDDFGTGYSSLAYLRRFPVDILKIDRTFVAGLGTDDQGTALTATVIELAHTLGMSTTAEGIEKPGQLAVLRRMGCDHAQGYYFSPPVAADQAGELLRDGAAARTAA